MKKLIIAAILFCAATAYAAPVEPVSQTAIYPKVPQWIHETFRYPLASVAAGTLGSSISLTFLSTVDRGIIEQVCVDSDSQDFTLSLSQRENAHLGSVNELVRVEDISESYCTSNMGVHFRNTDFTDGNVYLWYQLNNEDAVNATGTGYLDITIGRK